MGSVHADIAALEIIDHGPDYAVNDFMVTLPPDVLPDTLVSACQSVDGVKVLWVSRYHSDWGIESDIATLNRMSENPEQAAEILTEESPVVFHSTWAVLLHRGDQTVLAASSLAPDFTEGGLDAIGDLATVRTTELTAGWLPHWGDTVIAMAPLSGDRTIILGRQGGPSYLGSELTRLKHLATLAG